MEKNEKQVEIFPGMTVEEIKAAFFDSNALREPAYKIYQLNQEGHRYYYRFEDGQPVLYPSVTTLLHQTMPTSPFLIQWMLDNGAEGAAEKRDLAAAYGTFMHAQFERLVVARTYNFDEAPAELQKYMERENLPDKVYLDWLGKIRKDVLAFAQFMRDFKVVPLAIEIGLCHPGRHYAGCVDMPCLLTDPKTGEQFPAIVDFKSGRKGFWEEHELQLELYREMWNVNFPDLPVERIFNFAPKDWRKGPTYTLKEQTNSPNLAKIPALLALAAIEDSKRENSVTLISGEINLDAGEFADNYRTISVAELIKERQKTETQQESDDEAIFGPSDGDEGEK